MQVHAPMLDLVDAVLSWLEPQPDERGAGVRNAPGRHAAPGPAIVGSPASGYRSEGEHFYTWQPERADVVSWVEELGPFDRAGSQRGI